MKSKRNRVYNRKPDRPDGRDFMYSARQPDKAAPAALPPLVDLRLSMSPVMDQGQIGSCTANSGCGDMEYLELQDLKDHVVNTPEAFDPAQFETHSRLFLYYNERLMNGTTREDSGAEIRDTVKALQKYGTCPESMWPYNPHALFNKPSKTAYQVALQHRISAYYRCLNSADVKASLAAGFPVMIGIMIYESFESDQVAETGLVPMPDQQNEQIMGGHAVLVVGYDDAKKHFIVRNSWGTTWGDKGYFYLPYAFLADPSLASDFWTVRR